MRVVSRTLVSLVVSILAAGGRSTSAPVAPAPTTPPAAAPASAQAAPQATPAPSPARSVSGLMLGSQVWSGELLVTGGVQIVGDLTVMPGTTVRIVVGNDRHVGNEVPPDGFNNNDPTRLLAYGTTHSEVGVGGRLLAQGTADRPIVFTSASSAPHLADWVGLIFLGDGSLLEHVTVEWSRNGVTPHGKQPNSIIRDSIVRHAMWGCISGGESGMQVLNNDISDRGHEGVDVQAGDPVVRGNTIRDSHAGIVVLAGSPLIDGNVITNVGDGIGGSGVKGARVGQNTVTLAPPNSTLEWRYGDFAYHPFECPPPCGH